MGRSIVLVTLLWDLSLHALPVKREGGRVGALLIAVVLHDLST